MLNRHSIGCTAVDLAAFPTTVSNTKSIRLGLFFTVWLTTFTCLALDAMSGTKSPHSDTKCTPVTAAFSLATVASAEFLGVSLTSASWHTATISSLVKVAPIRVCPDKLTTSDEEADFTGVHVLFYFILTGDESGNHNKGWS
ncbi:unnamed protein product [Aphanomyces euteiches]